MDLGAITDCGAVSSVCVLLMQNKQGRGLPPPFFPSPAPYTWTVPSTGRVSLSPKPWDWVMPPMDCD